MGINSESDLETELQIGPTTEGMVRLYVRGNGVDLPMDFDPEDAEAIADDLRAAAEQARAASRKPAPRGKPGAGKRGRR